MTIQVPILNLRLFCRTGVEDMPPNDIEFSGEKEGARATDAESAAMRC
jgi:hypothetical protein